MKILWEDITQQGVDAVFTDSEAKPSDLADERVIVGIIEAPRAELRLMPMRGHMVRAEGVYSAVVEVVCGRCLQPNRLDLQGKLRVVFEKQPESAEEEIMLSQKDLEVYFYDGVELDLAALIRSELGLLIPYAPVCEGACVNTCFKCNRFITGDNCGCKPSGGDPRWSKLAGLKFED